MRYFRYSLIIAVLACGLVFVASVSALVVSKQYRALAQRLVGDAEIALAANQIDKADELANLALTANPANAEAYWVKAQAQRAKGDSEQSLRLVSVGLEIDPSNIAALGLQGDVAMELKKLDRAEVALKQLQAICKGACAEADKLQAALDAERANPQDK